MRIPVHHYGQKVDGSVLFRGPNFVPYRMGPIVAENSTYDYKVNSWNLETNENEEVDINDGTWHFGIPVPLGNIFVFETCYYPVISPRTSFRYGINGRSVYFDRRDRRSVPLFFDRSVRVPFLKMLRNEYPSFDEALELLKENKGVPISRNLYLYKQPSGIELCFRRYSIGDVRERTVFVNKEVFTDLVKEDLPDVEIVMKDETDERDL